MSPMTCRTCWPVMAHCPSEPPDPVEITVSRVVPCWKCILGRCKQICNSTLCQSDEWANPDSQQADTKKPTLNCSPDSSHIYLRLYISSYIEPLFVGLLPWISERLMGTISPRLIKLIHCLSLFWISLSLSDLAVDQDQTHHKQQSELGHSQRLN